MFGKNKNTPRFPIKNVQAEVAKINEILRLLEVCEIN